MKSSVIMYSLLCGLLLGSLTCTLQAQTILAGTFNQDTTLTSSGNPYHITGDLIVPNSATLTIMKGVRMIFDPGVTLRLRGKLKVLGTATDSVFLVGKNGTFGTSGPQGIWNGINGENSGASIWAKYMVGAHAENFIFPSDSLQLFNCSLIHHGKLIEANVAPYMLIDSCRIARCGVGVSAEVIEMYNTTVEYCHWGSLVYNSIISNCIFQHNSDVGLIIFNVVGGTVVENSIFRNNKEAIELRVRKVQLILLPDTTFFINNEIIDNKVGFDIHNDSSSTIIEIAVSKNLICNDSLNILFQDSARFSFANNCWCTLDSADILAKINWPLGTPPANPYIFTPFQRDCIPGEVYPGDANHDQVANVLDILTIGQYFGQTGPSRPNASLSWQGQDAPDWDSLQTTGYDLKHADCNGDSTIGWDDTLAIRLNYGRTHRSQRTASVNGIPLILQAPATAQNPGDTVRLPIVLGTVDTIASNIYGIAFSIHYDSTQVTPYPSVAFFNSWLGTPRTDMITFWHIDSLAHRVDVALVRTDGQARTGFGQIAELVVVLDDDITKREVPLRMYFSGIHAIDTSGTIIPVSGFVERTVVEVEDSGNLFRTYPNPAPNFIVVEPNTSAPYDVMLVDMTGKEWLHRTNLIGIQRISMANKPGGLYILQARTGGIMESFKVVHP